MTDFILFEIRNEYCLKKEKKIHYHYSASQHRDDSTDKHSFLTNASECT